MNLLGTIYHYESKDKLFYSIDFPSRILDKIENWSFLEICCSFYYFYFDETFQQRQRRGDPAINAQVWITASAFILNPALSVGFTQFIKKLELADHSDKSDILRGIINYLTRVPIKKHTLCSKIGLENLLTFVDIGNEKRNSFVKSTFAQQNSTQLLEVLLELQKNKNSFFTR